TCSRRSNGDASQIRTRSPRSSQRRPTFACSACSAFQRPFMLALIPLLPFLGFLVNASLGRRINKGVSGAVACGAMIGAFLVSVVVASRVIGAPEGADAIVTDLGDWITSGDFRVGLTLLADPLSTVMLLVITGIGSLIHIYSTAYMHEETSPEYARYFSYLN